MYRSTPYLYVNSVFCVDLFSFLMFRCVDILVLDNTYSWTRTKAVQYSVEIISANDESDNVLSQSALEVKDNQELITDLL